MIELKYNPSCTEVIHFSNVSVFRNPRASRAPCALAKLPPDRERIMNGTNLIWLSNAHPLYKCFVFPFFTHLRVVLDLGRGIVRARFDLYRLIKNYA